MKNPKNKAGVNRQHDKSTKQKISFTLMHLTTILFCSWLVFADGLKIMGNLFGSDWQFADLLRAKIILACAWLYYFLHIPGLDAYLVNRYGEEFKIYAKKTKKLIPFIY